MFSLAKLASDAGTQSAPMVLSRKKGVASLKQPPDGEGASSVPVPSRWHTSGVCSRWNNSGVAPMAEAFARTWLLVLSRRRDPARKAKSPVPSRLPASAGLRGAPGPGLCNTASVRDRGIRGEAKRTEAAGEGCACGGCCDGKSAEEPQEPPESSTGTGEARMPVDLCRTSGDVKWDPRSGRNANGEGSGEPMGLVGHIACATAAAISMAAAAAAPAGGLKPSAAAASTESEQPDLPPAGGLKVRARAAAAKEPPGEARAEPRRELAMGEAAGVGSQRSKSRCPGAASTAAPAATAIAAAGPPPSDAAASAFRAVAGNA